METLTLIQPVSGTLVPLEQVPDAVFSTQMLGRTVAFEPTGDTVIAPADGTVSFLAPTGHALVLSLDKEKVGVMIHIGLDTVHLGGTGFKILVEPGQHVSAGLPLVTFDPKVIKDAGLSLLSVVIVMGEPDVTIEFTES